MKNIKRYLNAGFEILKDYHPYIILSILASVSVIISVICLFYVAQQVWQ